MSSLPRRAPLGLAALVVAVALLHLVRLDIVLLLATPVTLACVLPMESTLAVRLVVAIGCWYCANFLLAWVAELVGIPFGPTIAALALLLPITLAVCLGWLVPRVGPVLDGGDAVALLGGFAVLALLWLPTARDNTASILSRLISDGEDNAAHLGIIQAITIQHGLLFGQAQRWSGRLLAGHTAYPQGFHLNVALLVSAVDRLFGRATTPHLVRTYFYSVIGLQGLWAVTTVMTIRALGTARRASLLALSVVGVAVGLFFLFGPPSALMNWGFQSQVAALWMLTFAILVAATTDLEAHPLVRLVIVLLALIGTTWSWYLVSPVVGILALGLTYLHRAALLQRWPVAAAAWAIGLLACLPPIIAGLQIGAPGYINANGGVYFLDRVFIATLVLAALATALLPAAHRGSDGWRLTMTTLVTAGLVAFAVHWYQVRTSGAAGYFYEKLLYTVGIVAALGAGILILALVSNAIAAVGASRIKQAAVALACAGAAWLSTGVLGYPNPGRHYLTGTRMFPDVGVMQHILVTPPPGDSRQVLFWADQPPVYDYLSSRFAAAIYLRNTDRRNDFMANNAYQPDDEQLLTLLHDSPNGLWLITRNPLLRDRLAGAGFAPADLDHVLIDTVTEPPDGSTAHRRSWDISPRGLFPGLFRAR